MSESNRQGRAYEAQVSSSPSARCKFSGFIPNSAFQIPHSKVGREGIEPLAATSIIKGAWFTARHEGHDPVWNVECGIGNAEHWFAHISQAIFRTPHSEFPIPTKSSRVDSNHRSTACKAGAFAARPRDVFDYSEFRIPHSKFPIPNSKSTPPRNRTSSNCFEDSHASSTPAGQNVVWF